MTKIDDQDREFATWQFNIQWQNDEAIYRAVLNYSKILLNGPRLSKIEFGKAIINAVKVWAEKVYIPGTYRAVKVPVNPEILRLFAQVEFDKVEPMQVFDQVAEALNIEEIPESYIETLDEMGGSCYSDHNEDIRTKGSCDYCHGTEIDE